jgi:hypothetical protein
MSDIDMTDDDGECICLDPGDAWGCGVHPQVAALTDRAIHCPLRCGLTTQYEAEMDRHVLRCNGPAPSTPTWRLEGTREISDAEREAFARVEHMLQPLDPNRSPAHIRDLTQPAQI